MASVFETLDNINVNDYTEKKDNGSTVLTYLSWSKAWEEVKKIYPGATYEIMRFGAGSLPYVFDEKTGYMVFTAVTIEGITHEMWLPVMDGRNKAMKDKPYEYSTRSGKKTVENASCCTTSAVNPWMKLRLKVLIWQCPFSAKQKTRRLMSDGNGWETYRCKPDT